MRITRIGDPEHATMLAALNFDPLVTLEPELLVMVQYVKIANYFGDSLSLPWGGDYLEHLDEFRLFEGSYRFRAEIQPLFTKEAPYIHRLDRTAAWSRDNIFMRSVPDSTLGSAHDPYVGANGILMPVQTASRLLAIEPLDLVRLKCKVILDHLVLEEAARRMCRPRPLWPAIPTPSGAT